jgi:hypothetical protein
MISRQGRVLLAAAAAATLATAAAAQPLDVQRPLVLVAGTPKGGARMIGIDASRAGLVSGTLPVGLLRTAWRTALGVVVAHGPLVDSRGTVYVVGDGGEVIALAPDGTVLSRVLTKSPQPGPPALLSDDTLVFADAAGEAIAVRAGGLRWRLRFGRPGLARGAPLPLDDGGVVLTTGRDVAILDAGGGERARMVLREPTSHPLLSALGKVVIVSDAGAVWSWSAPAADATLVGTFGSEVDGGGVLVDPHTLAAVVGNQTRISALDLLHGTVTRWAGSPGGFWLGAPAVTKKGLLCAMQATSAGEFAVAIDASGAELGRALVTGPPRIAGDAGALQNAARAQTSPIVDAAGSLAFATASGAVGVVARLASRLPGGASGTDKADASEVALLPEACSASARGEAAVVGVAPLPGSGLVAACRSGMIVAATAAAAHP